MKVVRLAEPGATPRAKVTILAEATNRRGERVTLAHIGRGWVPAGAMMRWAEPHYRVRVEGGYLAPSGATFTDEAEARARFARWSGVSEE